jgi:hypothetical protein
MKALRDRPGISEIWDRATHGFISHILTYEGSLLWTCAENHKCLLILEMEKCRLREMASHIHRHSFLPFFTQGFPSLCLVSNVMSESKADKVLTVNNYILVGHIVHKWRR